MSGYEADKYYARIASGELKEHEMDGALLDYLIELNYNKYLRAIASRDLKRAR